MEKNRGVIRELLKYEFELGHSVKAAIENINRAEGAGTVAQFTANKWYSKFKSGNLTIEDNPRSGRPREVDRDAVVNAVGNRCALIFVINLRCLKLMITQIINTGKEKHA
ncbi:histone-lysine N-methyltransferase SETMAR [Ditylenchus destructor]|nr:histone-lysine N-methyltransferase SETMAR [Ditylenchus destructor]